MVIDDARLVEGLIRNLDELAGLASLRQAQAVIKSSQTIAWELWRRTDASGAVRRYAAGRKLLESAADCTVLAKPTQRRVLRELLEALPTDLPPQRDAKAGDALFEELRRGISLCFNLSHYPLVEDAKFKEILDSMSEWERAAYALKPPAHFPVPPKDQLVVVDAGLIHAYLRNYCPGYERATVSGFTPVAGGFSKQTILFDVERPDGGVNVADPCERFVYRGATKIQIIEPVLVDIADEYHVVSYAFSQGAPVAEPLWLQSDDVATGTRYFVSRRVPGTNLGTTVQAHAPVSDAATRSLGEALARIHSLPLDTADALLRRSHIRPPEPGVSLDEVIRRRIDAWRAYFRSLNAPTYPALELAFQWLLDNVATAEGDAPVLVHGDYGLHNILVHEERVSAVLDWEACHVGDRALDLSHILAGTAGRMDHELFMAAYVAAGTNHCTLGLGFIEHTANSIVSGILEAGAAPGKA